MVQVQTLEVRPRTGYVKEGLVILIASNQLFGYQELVPPTKQWVPRLAILPQELHPIVREMWFMLSEGRLLFHGQELVNHFQCRRLTLCEYFVDDRSMRNKWLAGPARQW